MSSTKFSWYILQDDPIRRIGICGFISKECHKIESTLTIFTTVLSVTFLNGKLNKDNIDYCRMKPLIMFERFQ